MRSAPGARRLTALALVLTALLLFRIQSCHAARTDVVILHSGDHLTGEIKKLDFGKLEYKTDDMDNIYIEWVKIDHITSSNFFEVVDADGSKRFGMMGRTEAAGEIVITGMAGVDTLDLLSIVRITRIKETFLQRIKGSISVGFSYTRATETAELTLGGKTSYRGRQYYSTLDYSVYLTQQSERETRRWTVGMGLDRFLARRWTVGGRANLESNEELGLDRRLSLVANGSRFLVESNRTVLRLAVGLSGNQERYIGSDSLTYNVELPVTVDYSRFTFHNPESDIKMTATLYPSLTTRKRVRGSLDIDLMHELYKDLDFKIGFYYEHDSKPPKGAAKEDYRLSTSIAWSFS